MKAPTPTFELVSFSSSTIVESLIVKLLIINPEFPAQVPEKRGFVNPLIV